MDGAFKKQECSNCGKEPEKSGPSYIGEALEGLRPRIVPYEWFIDE